MDEQEIMKLINSKRKAIEGNLNKNGFKKFLQTFIDRNTPDTKFSNVADKIHNWRNILAHQWLGKSEYKIEYDYNMNFGYKLNGDLLIINPKIYFDCYIKAFSNVGKIWECEHFLIKEELEQSKNNIIEKFLEK